MPSADRRRNRPRDDEREELEKIWKANVERHKAWPATTEEINHAYSKTATLDVDGDPVWIVLRGKQAVARIKARDLHFAELRTKVQNWNRKPDRKTDVKDISGKDVMDVLEVAFALTNHPAYDAARNAMRVHRLDTGGLRRAFQDLQHRHGHIACEDLVEGCVGTPHSLGIVDQYMQEDGFAFLRAVEHSVAALGIPGTSFSNAVDKARKAYRKREQNAAARQEYLAQLQGLVKLTGSITGTALTVTAIAFGVVQKGATIFGIGVAADTIITALPNTGSDGVGTYTVSQSQTVPSQTILASSPEAR